MFVIIVKCVLFVLCLLLGAMKPLLILQQTSYRNGEFVSVVKRKRIYVLTSLIYVIISIPLSFVSWHFSIVLSITYCVFSVIAYKKGIKKPLVFTKRIYRLVSVYAILIILLTVSLCFNKYLFSLAFCSIFVLIMVNALCLPIEKKIALRFIRRAEAKLKKIHPMVIAITGSYGKTSFKNILAQILKTQYKVCVSPKSYNTPMGLAKCINENLEDSDEIFIAEAGARYRGDIAEICAFIKPNIAVVTAIGNQHLATFKTRENLAIEKFSIVCERVKKVFINGDEVEKIPCFSQDKTVTVCGKNERVGYSDVKRTIQGQTFIVRGKEKYELACPLLASYIPSTIALAVSIAESLGITQKNIKNSIKSLKPIAHRLEILYNDKDVIIDDAYNSNENGFKSAIDLLALFHDKIKVVITPGVVELGKEQAMVNTELGRYASVCVDHVLTYGVNAKAIKSGAENKCEIYANLSECMERYKSIQGERAVLFENDLPDVY